MALQEWLEMTGDPANGGMMRGLTVDRSKPAGLPANQKLVEKNGKTYVTDLGGRIIGEASKKVLEQRNASGNGDLVGNLGGLVGPTRTTGAGGGGTVPRATSPSAPARTTLPGAIGASGGSPAPSTGAPTGGMTPEQIAQMEQEYADQQSSLQQQAMDAAGNLQPSTSDSSSGLGPQGEALYGMAAPGAQGLGNLYQQYMTNFDQTPEGANAKLDVAKSLDAAKDRIRKDMARRGITDQNVIASAMAKADIAGGEAFSRNTLQGRALAQEGLLGMLNTASRFGASSGQSTGATPTAGVSALENMLSDLSREKIAAGGYASALGQGYGMGGY